MKKEILDIEDFSSVISSRFICVEIDFPRHHEQGQDEQTQNLSLKAKFDVNEYPRMIVIDSSEREIARIGYPSEKAKRFAENLIQIAARDERLGNIIQTLVQTHYSSEDLKSFYVEAKDLNREKDALRLLELGFESEDPLFFLLEKYRLLVEEGKSQKKEALSLKERLFQIDPQNLRGVHFSLALIEFQELASQKECKVIEEIIRPLENYLETFGSSDEENVWRIEMMIAQCYLNENKCQTALQHAETAFLSAPREKKTEIEQSLNYIRKQAATVVRSD